MVLDRVHLRDLSFVCLWPIAACLSCAGRDVARPVTPVVSLAAPSRTAFVGAEPAQKIPSDVAFESLEGPFWSAGQQALLFSDVVEQNGAGAKIYRYSPKLRSFAIEPYPAAATSTNGLAVDPQGHLVACERWNGALVRIANGKRAVIADRFPAIGGLSFAAPNDVTIGSDGTIYFTDTKWGAQPGAHAAQAVYRVTPDGRLSVVDAVSMPNGVALSPDGRTLYVGSDAQNLVWKLAINATGEVSVATVLLDASHVPGGLFKVPDGICIDDAGDLYVANNDDAVKAIEVFASDGKYLGDIALPDRPSNCTFGGEDRRTLYVTTLHAVYEVRVATPGVP